MISILRQYRRLAGAELVAALAVLLLPLAFDGNAPLAQEQTPDPRMLMLQQEISGIRRHQAELRSLLSSESQDRRSLEGRIETAEFRLNTLERRLDDLILSLDGRLADIEAQLEQRNAGENSSPDSDPAVLSTTPFQPRTTASGATPSETTPETPLEAIREPAVGPVAGPAVGPVMGPVDDDNASAFDDQQTQSLGTLTRDADGNVTDALPASGAPSVEERYQQAIDLLERKQYARAREQLLALWGDHRDHALASNMLYWIGETYYVEQDFDRAISSFARSALEYPQGAKAQASLLKLSNALGALGRNADACRTLAQMQAERLEPEMMLLRNRALSQYSCH